MSKSLLFLTILALFIACGKEESSTCISNCNTSRPGKINIAIEEHTNLDINGVALTINEQTVPFNLLLKSQKGQYSCWQTFDQITEISAIQFKLGLDSTITQRVNYQNLTAKEYAIDIQFVDDAFRGASFRVQLKENPGCVSDAD